LWVRFDPSNGDLLVRGPGGLRFPLQITPGSPDTVVFQRPKHFGPISSTDCDFDISRDGKVAAVASLKYNFATIWRDDPRKVDFIGGVGPHGTRAVRLSPDGSRILTILHGKDSGLLWDSVGHRKIAELPEAGFFTNDGRWLTTGRRRWAADTGQEGPPVSITEGPTAIAFSPDETMFVGQSTDEAMHLVDAATGRTLVKLGLPEPGRSWYAAFSPDGAQLLHVPKDHGYVCAWDLRVLRRHLADLGLDWEAPSFPPAPESEQYDPPVVQRTPGSAIGNLWVPIHPLELAP
jgi:WD40 repeat protein